MVSLRFNLNGNVNENMFPLAFELFTIVRIDMEEEGEDRAKEEGCEKLAHLNSVLTFHKLDQAQGNGPREPSITGVSAKH